MTKSPEVSAYIAGAPESHQEVLVALRNLIHELDNVSEAIKWKFPVFEKNGKDFAYLRVAKGHVTLGFYNIDKIEDPKNLLEGEGTTLKHIKVKSLEGINAPVIRKWLEQITA